MSSDLSKQLLVKRTEIVTTNAIKKIISKALDNHTQKLKSELEILKEKQRLAAEANTKAKVKRV